MPAGVSWPKYLKFLSAAMFSMLLGSQSVHLIYRPLDNLDELVAMKKATYLENVNKDKNS